jgi:hypothetical protein
MMGAIGVTTGFVGYALYMVSCAAAMACQYSAVPALAGHKHW